MFPVMKKEKIAENTYSIQIKSPEIAKKALPGQFVILRLSETSERIPMTIADSDRTSITIVMGVVGKTTADMEKLRKGDGILDLVGPLGNPTEVKQYGNVCLIGVGCGAAVVYPKAKAMKKAGNRVIIIIGAKDKKSLFWEDKLKKVSHDLIITTEDGSKGIEGTVIDGIKKYLYPRSRLQRIMIVAPPPVMRQVCDMTKQLVRTIVSLNTVMMDGIGLCGGCRVRVDGDMRFACVEGPEFDGHKVDWDALINRTRLYLDEEHKCRIKYYNK